MAVGALVGASGALSLFSMFSSMRNADASASYSKSVADANAAQARNAAAIEEDTSRFRTGRLMATQRANYAASGLSFEGSPLEVMGDTAAQAELDALRIRYGGEVQARAEEAKKPLYDYQAKQAKSQAIMGFGQTLLTGASLLRSDKK